MPKDWYNILESHKNVRLQLEPENPVDENAIAIYSEFDIKLGYVPRFYSSGISALLMNGMSPNLALVGG